MTRTGIRGPAVGLGLALGFLALVWTPLSGPLSGSLSGTGHGAAWAQDAPPARVAERKRPVMERTEKKIAGGTHWRIASDNGPIHVWIPPGYDRKKAGLVIYVHGYRISADGAWKHHKLAEQFRASRQQAMFLVIEAPKSNEEEVSWDSLGDLKKMVRRAGMRLPDGPTVAVAHSGGFRTLARWVDNRLLAQVILLDAMYGSKNKFEDFIHSGKRAQHHKMVLVAASTSEESKKFAERFPYAAVRDDVPDDYSGFTDREKRAKLLYIRSQYGHSAIADGGKVLPLMLRLTPLAKL